jgi:4-amino-4-deoxy-L-arabinose transferase-like glycosyltransferase
MDEQRDPTIPGRGVGRWVRANLPVLLFALLLLAVLPMRDLWAPDEPDFAQCVKEMRHLGSWLLPYLNGQPYSEKPILYYWMMKGSAIGLDALTGGLGFTQGVAAWALRLPSVVASVAFMVAFQRWIRRFMPGRAELALMILATTPLWFWQSQFIQIDLLFAALLAWSWLCWLAGYLTMGQGPAEDSRRWFLQAYLWLALAFLAKGPLAPVLSLLLVGTFLLWQRDLKALRRTGIVAGLLITLVLVAPWYVAAGLKGGPHYAYQMIIYQNFDRATHAWDHIQPWWEYGLYMLGDFFPWVLFLPALALHIRRTGAFRDPLRRFLVLAFVVPFLFLSAVQSKQGKYLLMAYPFLALLLADVWHALAEGGSGTRTRRLGGLLAAGLALPAGALLAVALGAGGAKLQGQVGPYLGPVRLMALVMVAGAVSTLVLALRGRGRHLVPAASLSLGLLFLVGGTWGFHRLDPAKSYRRWTAAVQPLIAGRKVYYWQTIRSGVMVYTDHLMPEIRDASGLARLAPGDRLVAQRNEWEMDAWGMTPALRAQFEVLLSVPTGGGHILLLKKK